MIFQAWCANQEQTVGLKRLLRLTELPGGRAAIENDLPEIIRSHYDDLARISDDVRELGYPGAAAILAERLPRSPRARSGELGEILAVELVEETTDFVIPVRRLRYKDGREMALRGDDFIGLLEVGGEISLLKGESKSRVHLSAAPIQEGRAALMRDAGRPTPISLLFVAERLMDVEGADAELGRRLRNEVVARAIPTRRIDHALFTFSENATPQALLDDFDNAEEGRSHLIAHLQVEGHQAFIEISYERALALGNA